jgi:hypothetical protein
MAVPAMNKLAKRISFVFIFNWVVILFGLFNYLSFRRAKLRKKLVKTKLFWKINAFRPKIEARRGRTVKFKNRDNAKLGGLVKELGCQIVTSFSHLLHLCDDAFEARQQFFDKRSGKPITS